MIQSTPNPKKSLLRFTVAALLAVPLAAYAQVGEAEPPGQWTFASAEEASRALFVAVQGQDASTLVKVLGQNEELISSSDAAQDELDRAQFVRKYQQMHRLVPTADGVMLLYLGAENWPFPVPLVFQGGAWRYDSDAGAQEVVYRRIGENELAAMQACHTMLSGTRTEQKPFLSHGYSFRVLTTPGHHKHEFVTYPVTYGSTGVMTFIVNDSGVVYQKDLGANTESTATKLTAYPVDSTWTRVEMGR